MAINKTKLSDGGEIGEVQRRRTILDKLKKWSLKKKVIVTTVFLIGLIIVLYSYGVIIGVKNQHQKSTGTNTVCIDVYSDYSKLEQTQDPKQVSGLEKKIVSRSGYDKDTDCLFIVVRYHLLRGDTIMAGYYYDKFAPIYTEHGFGGIPIQQRNERLDITQKDIEAGRSQFDQRLQQNGIPKEDFEKYKEDYIKNRQPV